MSKGVYRLRPADSWRIGEHESWLTDMAGQGLHLEKVGWIFARFTKGEPREMRYRIELSQGRKLTLDEKEMYGEWGWKYITTYGQFNVFASSAEENIPELHTDPAEQSYTLGYLEKKLKKNTVILAVCLMLVVISFVFASWFIDTGFYLSLVETNTTLVHFISLIIEFVLVFIYLQAVISIRTLKKTLSEGRAINHSAPWKAKFRGNLMVRIITVGLLVSQITLLSNQIVTFKRESLPVISGNLPIVRLAEVEKNSALERYSRPIFNTNNIDVFNNYRDAWSLFAPVQYASNETGIIEGEGWKQNESSTISYTPNIKTSMYKLSFPSMKEQVLEDLVKRNSIVYKGEVISFTEKEHPGFDKLFIYERKASWSGEDMKEVIAVKGKGVICIIYEGKAELDSIIEAAAEKLGLISE